MAITKYIAQALAFTSTVYAGCSASSATTIVNPAGASALATCTTYSGDVVLATGVANNKVVDLGDTLTKIDGKLTYTDDSTVSSIKAGSLQHVGDLTIGNLSALSKLDLSGLQSTGDANFYGLAILQDLGIGGNLASTKGVKIINNQITSLGGISTVSQMDSLLISDNNYLQKVDLAVKSIGSVEIGSGKSDQSSSMPNLVSADNLIFRNMTSISIPKLVNLTENLEILACFFQSFSAPNLTTSGGFFCNDNPNLTNFTLPALKSLTGDNGALQIANNSHLSHIEGFPILQNVDFDIDLSGSFSTADFPKLQNVGGAMTVDTSAQNFDCSKISGFEGNIVKGKVKCTPGDSNPTKADGTDGSGSSGSSNNNGSGAGSVNVPLFLAAATVMSSMLSMLFL